ncbi:MAG: hypothetical protein JNK77_15880 [Saprospiraceae bacterium]|nr:hypothetical protein [Saprospiraceae bacterium]
MKKFALKSSFWLVALTAFILLTGCQNPSKSQKWSKEEKEKMDVLQNEVIRKIEEIATITGRLLGKKLSPVGKFEVNINENRTETSGKVTPLDDELVIGYYCDPPGICSTDPCESASTKLPFIGADSIQMKVLQRELVGSIDKIGVIIGTSLGKKLSPVGKFIITVKGKGTSRTVHIEMEPIIVTGDGNGCASDPPGISCECPCPE